MKKRLTALTPVVAALLLSACASYDGLGRISPDAKPNVGKITAKETVINRVVENGPVYTGFGYGGFGGFGYGRYGRGGFGGWGYDPFFDGGYTRVRDDVFYQYKVTLGKDERMTLQSPYNLEVGQCVTVWQVPNSNQYPRVDKNLDCTLPVLPVASTTMATPKAPAAKKP